MAKIQEEDLIKKYHLEDMKKRFQEIVEYTFITKPVISEEGDEDNEQNQQTDADNNAENPENANNAAPEQDTPEVTDVPDEADDDIEPQEQGQDQEGEVEITPMEDGDEVIDVDDLTNSQQEVEYKVDGVDDKLVRIAKVIDKLIPAIEANNSKIEDLRAEFEKRNPTEDEKINLRSQDSYPYSVKPKDYWNSKKDDPNYNVITNNNVAPNEEQKEYVLKKSDIVNNGVDDRTVYKTFDTPRKMSDYFDLF